MFFHFNQNNSGGSFDTDESVAHHVFIEARNASDANMKAQSIGIYFDGIENGIDCECCGDRWYRAYDDSSDTEPLIYGKSPEEYKEIWGKKGDVFCHVYYLNGNKVSYTK
jgi:hypothetical protein